MQQPGPFFWNFFAATQNGTQYFVWAPRADACAKDQPFFICDKHSAPVDQTSGGPANSDILWQLPLGLHSARQWSQSQLEDTQIWGSCCKVCFWLFDTRYAHQWHAGGCFFRALVVLIPPCTKEHKCQSCFGGPVQFFQDNPGISSMLFDCLPDFAGRQ